jgi:hypothetical protein
MKFEDWLVGVAYAVKEKSGLVLELGTVLQRYQIDQIVAIDFRKECGAEYLYIVDNSETYVIHRSLQEAPDTTHRAVPSMLADPS